ncbi:unnamed protein product [Trifolium pratense]|uniref:Uncharacterized protein n=1 Tax=Trifolium pratense TaxID=57577 RepID=A0ACB0M281_TRIPR|nr:unnamed protein product [Trifolium pratense]
MDEECNSSQQSILTVQSAPKIMNEKRVNTHLGDKHEPSRKRVKMRDLESLVHSTEKAIGKENIVQSSCGENEMSQITKVPLTVDMNVSKEEQDGRNTLGSPRILDLNTEVCGTRQSGGFGEKLGDDKESLSEMKEREDQGGDAVNTKGINVDLNAEDDTSSVNVEPASFQREHGHFQSKDVSESGSSAGPPKEKDSMRIWMEMKRNGFISSVHGGIPVPKKRGRKSKTEILEQKMELAKREQINRFTKIAAPSGLLNDLNPGIINHVRNKKQVHSIIEALVTEKHENRSKREAHRMSGGIDFNKRDLECVKDPSKHQPTFSHEEGTFYGSAVGRQARKSHATKNDSSWILEDKGCDRDTYSVEKAGLKNCVSNASHVTEDNALSLKLSSSMKASMSSTSLSNEESSVSSLSLKAATVASQWLELLHQDIKGRLATLRRSRRRVRSVITTELPFQMSKEFGDNPNFDPCGMKFPEGLSTSKIAELHQARWTALFDHMDEALSEEEKQLESWLNQIKEKQLLCDQGLQHVNWSKAYGLQQLGTSENHSRPSQLDNSEKELAVNAAAASIYSTCNFLLSELSCI